MPRLAKYPSIPKMSKSQIWMPRLAKYPSIPKMSKSHTTQTMFANRTRHARLMASLVPPSCPADRALSFTQ